jgi:hypothetical protein
MVPKRYRVAVVERRVARALFPFLFFIWTEMSAANIPYL